MATIKIRHLVTKKRKDGRTRYYWQPPAALRPHGWKLTRLSDDYAAAIQHAEIINNQVDEWRAGTLQNPTTARPGTVQDVIEKYRNSRDFRDIADRTRKDYDAYLIKIDLWAGDQLAVNISAKMVQDLYETVCDQKPAQAAYLVRVIRILFNYAERQSIIPKNTNPATKPKLRYKAPKGKLWSRAAVQAFVRQAGDMGHYAIGTAVMLNEWLGQRRGDILSIRMDAYKDGKLIITQSKTGAVVELAIDEVPHLKARIEAQIKINRARQTPGVTLIQQENGQPYSGDWFGHAFAAIRKQAATECAELVGMIFKDLRHTAVTRLTEAGATIQEIAGVTGHSYKACQDIVDRYNIRTAKAAQSAFIKRREAERS